MLGLILAIVPNLLKWTPMHEPLPKRADFLFFQRRVKYWLAYWVQPEALQL